MPTGVEGDSALTEAARIEAIAAKRRHQEALLEKKRTKKIANKEKKANKKVSYIPGFGPALYKILFYK